MFVMEYNTVQFYIRAIETIEFNAKDENSAKTRSK